MKYTIKRVIEGDYRPEDGEPFAVTESGHGYIIWCRTPILDDLGPLIVEHYRSVNLQIADGK